ncbi:MAG: glycosyltransferase [Patescibacteria group bacterium]
MKVALIHEHLAQDGGAENVLRSFQKIYPEAPTYTLVYNKKEANPEFHGKDIRTSFIQRSPWGVRHYRWYLTLMPTAIESFDLSSYDVVLSSASAFAKGVITQPHTMHVCYCHSPTRYLWTDSHSYVQGLNYSNFIKKFIPPFLSRLRVWDKLAADRPDYYLANSLTVKKRITKYYRRHSDVIHPPVSVEQFTISDKIGNYYLIGGRLVSYKRYDLAVQAFNKLGLPLKIYGTGPEYKKLKEMAKDNIEFLGQVTNEERKKLYAECIAFIHPQEEDFGITPLEAMASGRPTIAYAAGGALETILPGITGEYFEDQDWESLADKVIRLKPENYDPLKIRAHAEEFSEEKFKTRIKQYIEDKWREFNNKNYP